MMTTKEEYHFFPIYGNLVPLKRKRLKVELLFFIIIIILFKLIWMRYGNLEIHTEILQ